MQVFTSDHALKLEWVPNWIAIIGSGYIGLEFSDVYTALGSEVTFIEVKPLYPSSDLGFLTRKISWPYPQCTVPYCCTVCIVHCCQGLLSIDDVGVQQIKDSCLFSDKSGVMEC